MPRRTAQSLASAAASHRQIVPRIREGAENVQHVLNFRAFVKAATRYGYKGNSGGLQCVHHTRKPGRSPKKQCHIGPFDALTFVEPEQSLGEQPRRALACELRRFTEPH